MNWPVEDIILQSILFALIVGSRTLRNKRARVLIYVVIFVFAIGSSLRPFNLVNAIVATFLLLCLAAEFYSPRESKDNTSCAWARPVTYVVLRRLSWLAVMPLAIYGSKNFWPNVFSAEAVFGIFQVPLFALAVDFTRYWIHRGQHHIPHWWNFHKVHHATSHLKMAADAPTNLIEFIVLKRMVPVGIFITFGFSEVAWLMFPVFGFFGTYWAHANVNFPVRISGIWRIINSPNYHALHHRQTQTNWNFAEIFVFWDYLFGTYRDPQLHQHEPFGLGEADSDYERLGIFRQQVHPILGKPR